MEAARADEEAAARMAASSHSSSPRFHTPPDGPSILAHLAHSGALNGKVRTAKSTFTVVANPAKFAVLGVTISMLLRLQCHAMNTSSCAV